MSERDGDGTTATPANSLLTAVGEETNDINAPMEPPAAQLSLDDEAHHSSSISRHQLSSSTSALAGDRSLSSNFNLCEPPRISPSSRRRRRRQCYNRSLLSVQQPIQSGGGGKSKHSFRHSKHRFRAYFRCAAFLTLVVGSCLMRAVWVLPSPSSSQRPSGESTPSRLGDSAISHSTAIQDDKGREEGDESVVIENGRIIQLRRRRRLEEEEAAGASPNSNDTEGVAAPENDQEEDEECTEIEDDLPRVDRIELLLPYLLGVLYTFVAVAIVCDEFFVPALEEMAGDNYLNLSMDVAGATLMAAGGSAPELFTSLVGTFRESGVGFGTIVGSAVFNVLFVVGMCAVWSKDILTLTPWPLARDCACYSVGLLVLASFCGYFSPGEIEAWEAGVQFALYVGYVMVMKYNERMHQWLKGNVLSVKVSADATRTSDTPVTATNVAFTEADGARGGDDNEKGEAPPSRLSASKETVKPSTFRAGLLTMFMGKGSLLEKVGVGMVTKISGDVTTVFQRLDESGDGFIDKNEFHNLMKLLHCTVSEDDLTAALNELDDNGDGKIDLIEFTKWYIKSESRLRSELRTTFDEFDVDRSGGIDSSELKKLLCTLGSEVTDDDIQSFFEETYVTGETDQISYDEFEAWYTQSSYWTERKAKVDVCTDDVVDPISDHLKPPPCGSSNLFDWVRWALLFPIVLVLCMTVPDVGRPGNGRWCFVAFFLSISWIGCFTYFMVTWAEIIGNTLGIPMVLMGLTFLAAGTSVPDLISSIIVARMGEGDMAVSSSIGSNIFDITVGLPVPWLLYILSTNGVDAVTIGTKGMEISIVILLAMLLSIITMIHLSGWKMTKTLGAGMFILYFVYLAQAVVREHPFSTPC